MVGGALEQAQAEAGFDLFDGVSDRGTGLAEILGGGGKAAAFDDTSEDAHWIARVHH